MFEGDGESVVGGGDSWLLTLWEPPAPPHIPNKCRPLVAQWGQKSHGCCVGRGYDEETRGTSKGETPGRTSRARGQFNMEQRLELQEEKTNQKHADGVTKIIIVQSNLHYLQTRLS